MKAQLKAALTVSVLVLLVGLAGCGSSAPTEEQAANRSETSSSGSGSMAAGGERGQ